MNQELIDKAFPQFDPALRQELSMRGTLRVYETGQAILSTGDTVSHTHLILKGTIKLTRESGNGEELVVAFIKQGNAFGVTLSTDSPASSKIAELTFIPIEPTTVLLIPYADKDLMAKKYDEWYKYILQTALMYYAFFLEMIDHIAFKNLEFRIRFFIMRLCSMKEQTKLHISHQEIATSLNVSREAVSRALKKLENEGLLILFHNGLLVIEQEYL